MKKFLNYILGLFLFVISCSEGINPSEEKPLQVHYRVYGTWIQPSLLAVDSAGNATMYRLLPVLLGQRRQRFHGFDGNGKRNIVAIV